MLILLALVLGIVFWRLAASEVEDASDGERQIAFGSAQRLLDCQETEEIDSLEGPIRAGAADRGVVCSTDGATIHLFEAARIGKWGGLDYRDALGLGDVVNPHAPECPAQVTVGRGLIIVSPSAEVARRVEDVLDIHSTTLPMAYPPGSYKLPC